jgi:amphi-Trp domain-containing protein
MPGSEDFTYESLQDAEAVAQYLRALADGIAAGALKLRSDGRALELTPNGLLRFRLEGKHGRHRARVVMKVSWRHSAEPSEVQREILNIEPSS